MEPTAIRRPPGLSDLNFDTLLPIISLLTTRDVAHLTRTCHTLRRALSAELLREGVNLEGRHLTSFLAFTDVKHGKDRVSYLEGLRLLGSTYKTISSGDQVMSSKDVKRTLSTILLAASNLKYLFIRDLNMFHFRPRELKTLLDSLPCLQLLEMQGVQNKYEGVLVDVIPRLRSLGLDVLEDCDLNVFLKTRECSSLHDMMLYGRTFNLQDVSLSFPSVRTLYASPANLPSDIDALTRIFPNITHLTLLFPPQLHPPGLRVPEGPARVPPGRRLVARMVQRLHLDQLACPPARAPRTQGRRVAAPAEPPRHGDGDGADGMAWPGVSSAPLRAVRLATGHEARRAQKHPAGAASGMLGSPPRHGALALGVRDEQAVRVDDAVRPPVHAVRHGAHCHRL